MSTSAPTAGQRVPWTKRADLKVVPLEFAGRRSWGIKDPLTLAYYELRDEEYFVLQQLSGQATVDDICNSFNDRFRPATLSPAELQQFIGQLISQGLLIAAGAGYGRMLVARDQQTRSRRFWMRLSSVLCIRFRGIDPDWLLEWLLNRIGWIFSPAMLFASLLLIGWGIVLVVVQFDHVIERLPDAHALLATQNLIWLPMLLAVVKVLHEFGHGLACKRFGGECRELGAMLLVFTPTLYCNVSDSWMLRDKWKRIAVSAAGMWVELIIASISTLLWWFSTPGLFHSMCLNLMIICGVSTLLFNGNPLLRYDGYFILSDWLEIPNLQQQSVESIRGGICWWFCGIRDRSFADSSRARRWLLLGYGVASSTYRVLLAFLILWSLYYWLEPYGLAAFVQLLAVPMIGLMFLRPVLAASRFFRTSQNRQQINWPRLVSRAAFCGLLLIAILFLPVPSRVRAGALLDQGDAHRVYSTLGGTLVQSVKLGATVEAGQEVARLVDPQLQTQLVRLEGEYNLHVLRLGQLERRRILDPEVAALIPATREAKHDFEVQLTQLRDAAERLVLKSPCDGIVLPAMPQSGLALPGALPTWAGSALDDQNTGCFVKPGTTLCLVGLRESREATLLVNQDDINLVQIGQPVRTVWRELAGEVLTGNVTEIAALDLETLPREAVQRLNLPARSTSDGTLVPVGTWYRVRVHLDSTNLPLVRNSAGEAKILVAPQSLGRSMLRWLSRTFAL
jgi:putative peptide zinc metalloprotease protein